MSTEKNVLQEVRNVLSQTPRELSFPAGIFMGEIFLSKDMVSPSSASLDKFSQSK